MHRVPLIVGLACWAVVLAGCGGSSTGGQSGTQITVPAYGVFPARTVTVAAGQRDSAACREDAGTFTDDALRFLAHSGPQAAYPADLYLLDLRDVFVLFESHGCDPALLGTALKRRLTTGQRRALVVGLPNTIAPTVSEALRKATG